MNSVFELTKELAHYSNDVNLRINELASSTNETLGKHQYLAADFAEFSQKILTNLSVDEANELTGFVSAVLNLYEESSANFKMQINMLASNTDRAKIYVTNYEKVAGI